MTNDAAAGLPSVAKEGNRPDNQFQFAVRKVVPAAEYVKNASEQDRSFLEAARVVQIHIVYVDIQEGGTQNIEIPVFMRISGGQARCLGFGNPRVQANK